MENNLVTRKPLYLLDEVLPARSGYILAVVIAGLLAGCGNDSEMEIIEVVDDGPSIVEDHGSFEGDDPGESLDDDVDDPPTATVEGWPPTELPRRELGLVDPDQQVVLEQEPPMDSEDPPRVDSDGDGYLDEDENSAGTDPDDSDSRIYSGGWPYNRNKAELESTAWHGEPEVGRQLPNFRMQDQFGEDFDLYDMAGQGRPIILDMGSPICRSCQNLAAFMSDGDMEGHMRYTIGPYEGEYVRYWQPEYEPIYELVQNGDVLWVTILSWPFEWRVDRPIDQQHCADWAEAFPHSRIPVVADADGAFRRHINRNGTPMLVLLDENFTVLSNSTFGAFQTVLAEDGPLND